MRGMEWRRVIAIRSLLLIVEMQLVAASIFFEGRLLMIAAQYCSLESVLVAFLCIHYMCSGRTSTAIVNSFFTASNSNTSLLQDNTRAFYNKHGSTSPNTLIITDILT